MNILYERIERRMILLIKYGWYFLLAAIVGEIIIPFVLAPFYKGYSHTTMVISVLGNINSPVRLPFNLWMLAAGVSFLLSTPAVYSLYHGISIPLSLATVLFIGIFAMGACIFMDALNYAPFFAKMTMLPLPVMSQRCIFTEAVRLLMETLVAIFILHVQNKYLLPRDPFSGYFVCIGIIDRVG